MGQPGPLWDNLAIVHYISADLKATIVVAMSVSKEEIEKVNKMRNSSVQFFDGGYMASLGAFHQMHCLVRAHSRYSACS